MSSFHGEYARSWTDLQHAINADGLRDISLRQTDSAKCDIKYSQSVPEYRAARDTGVELGITAISRPADAQLYTVTALLSRIGMAVHMHTATSTNAIKLIKEILTGEDCQPSYGETTMDFFDPHTGNHSNPTTPPRTMTPRLPPTPDIVPRPMPRRLFNPQDRPSSPTP